MFPFVVILPFSFSYFEDKETQTYNFYVSRMGKKNYILSKAIVSFCGSFLIIFIPFLLNMLLNHITYLETKIHIAVYDFPIYIAQVLLMTHRLTIQNVFISIVHKMSNII